MRDGHFAVNVGKETCAKRMGGSHAAAVGASTHAAQDWPVAISVILPVYNAARTLERALTSVFVQTLRDLEVIACDDGSQDDSAALFERLAVGDNRLRMLKESKNCGPAAARNRALSVARGRWVAILDADDWYAPERLGELVRLGEATGADFLVDNQYLYDAGKGLIIGTGLPAGNACAPLSLDDLLRNSMTGRAAYDYGLLQPVIRRDFLLRNGIRYMEECRFGEDFLLALDCLAAGAKGLLTYRPMYYVTQPHGVCSGMLSAPEREFYDYSAMRCYNDMAARRYRGRITERQIGMLRRRSQSMERYACYVRLTVGSRRRPWRLAATLCRPNLWPYLARSLARGVQALRASIRRRPVL
jgi:succinoglycan biosynthesis protein ExoO